MFMLNLFVYVEKSCCKIVNFDGAVEEEEEKHLDQITPKLLIKFE